MLQGREWSDFDQYSQQSLVDNIVLLNPELMVQVRIRFVGLKRKLSYTLVAIHLSLRPIFITGPDKAKTLPKTTVERVLKVKNEE